MSQLGVLISSDNFNGQTGLVYYKRLNGSVINLGEQTIPFTYSPHDGDPQGTYFIYFSATSVTCELLVFSPLPSQTPTPTVTMTPSQTPDSGTVLAYIGPGSVIIDYEVTVDRLTPRDIEFILTQELKFDGGISEYIVNNFSISSGTTT